MSERPLDDFDSGVRAWSDRVAQLAVDELLCAGIVTRDQFERACAITAEEIYVRVVMGDRPPPPPPGSERR